MASSVRPPKPEYLQFLAVYGPRITQLALATRALVLEEAPESVELIYDAYSAVSAGYSFTGRPSDCFVYVAAYEKRVNLGFWRGARFDDPQKILQGSGKMARHLKIEQPSDLEKPAVRAFVRMAIAEADRPDEDEGEGSVEGQSVVRAVYAKKRRPVTRPPSPRPRPKS